VDYPKSIHGLSWRVVLQISVVCSDRGFVNQRTEELHSAWLKRMLVGFARTSEYSGPAVPRQSPCFSQADEVRGCSLQPLLALPFRIFGSAPALQSFDFAKMLTVSLLYIRIM